MILRLARHLTAVLALLLVTLLAVPSARAQEPATDLAVFAQPEFAEAARRLAEAARRDLKPLASSYAGDYLLKDPTLAHTDLEAVFLSSVSLPGAQDPKAYIDGFEDHDAGDPLDWYSRYYTFVRVRQVLWERSLAPTPAGGADDAARDKRHLEDANRTLNAIAEALVAAFPDWETGTLTPETPPGLSVTTFAMRPAGDGRRILLIASACAAQYVRITVVFLTPGWPK